MMKKHVINLLSAVYAKRVVKDKGRFSSQLCLNMFLYLKWLDRLCVQRTFSVNSFKTCSYLKRLFINVSV